MWETAPSATTYLEAATETARWIRSAAQQSAHGLTWLPEPDHPEKVTSTGPRGGMYSGSAGIILFYLQLAQATGDAAYLEDAKQGADDLAATWRELLDFPNRLGGANANLSFYQGLSGVAFSLAEAHRATGIDRYRDAALAITSHIVHSAKPVDDGIEWTGVSSLMGDGSILLYLLWAARALGDPSYIETATRAGDRIITLAERDPRGGLRWYGYPLERFGAPAGSYAPNFELGTAGVAYALARLYAETGEQRFLATAREGAAHVQALATVRGDAALLLYREPDYPNLYYLGFCHGPVGTARLFYELYRLTNDRAYLQWTDRFAQGIVQSGVPERQTPGLWNVVCQCCGTAGVADLFLGLWAANQRPDYLAFAKRVANQLLSQASDFDGKGARWYQAWTRVKPWEVTAETGYMIGAAGVGSALVHLALAEQGRYEAITFPDNPFPRVVQA
jgi:lantibiotic modifying enzyme